MDKFIAPTSDKVFWKTFLQAILIEGLIILFLSFNLREGGVNFNLMQGLSFFGFFAFFYIAFKIGFEWKNRQK